MLIVTERYWVRTVAKRWADQYADGKHGADKLDILQRLRMLDEEITPAKDVDAIIGNSSWTTQKCSECKLPVRNAVIFDTSCGCCTLCLPCLRTAMLAANGVGA